MKLSYPISWKEGWGWGGGVESMVIVKEEYSVTPKTQKLGHACNNTNDSLKSADQCKDRSFCCVCQSLSLSCLSDNTYIKRELDKFNFDIDIFCLCRWLQFYTFISIERTMLHQHCDVRSVHREQACVVENWKIKCLNILERLCQLVFEIALYKVEFSCRMWWILIFPKFRKI